MFNVHRVFSVFPNLEFWERHDQLFVRELVLERWHVRVALVLVGEQRDDDRLAVGQQASVYLGAADDIYFAGQIKVPKKGDAIDDLDVLGRFQRSAEDDVSAAWKKFVRQALVRFTSHHDRVPDRQVLKELLVLFQFPRDRVPLADDPTRGHGRNGVEFWGHGFCSRFFKLVSISVAAFT